MKYIYIILACFVLISCKKDEVQPQDQNNDPIPTPSPITELTCHFSGYIGGATLEFTQNVLGYDGVSDNTIVINSSPILSEAIYSFSLESSSALSSIEILHGTVLWDYSISTKPSLAQFNEFHSTESNPAYADSGLNGFEVRYTDNTGTIWKSSASSVNAQSVLFNNIVLESGSNGDFAKYDCNFSCYVYNTEASDSLLIDNALLHGWFKR